MKKIYFLSLFCGLSIAAAAQTTVDIYPVGGVGSYITGNTDGVTRNDDAIISTTGGAVGYAVFDLSVLPPGAAIMTCTIKFNTATYGGGGTPSLFNTFGYVGDLSTVTVPATLYSDIMTGGTSISTASYGTATGNQTIPSSVAITNFISTNMAGVVSVSFTGGGTRIYTITGESGTSTLTGAHKPYLEVQYCPMPISVLPSATPNPICSGQTLTLNTTYTIPGTGGTVSYLWNGPGGYTAASKTNTFPAALTSAGIYTVTVTDACGAYSASATGTTQSVTVNPTPAAITGSAAVCTTNTTQLTDATTLGTWSSSATTIATVNSGGLVSGIGVVGVATISYIMPVTGCYVTQSMTVNAPPAAITGLTKVCQNYAITLTETSGGGTWSPSASTVATVDGTGDVTGVGSGPVTISYTIPGCPAATYPITVNPKPGPIGGGPNVCIGLTSPTTLTDPYFGGTWTSTNTTASIFTGYGTTKLYGGTVGVDTIIYTIITTGCSDSSVMNIVTGPVGITGPSSVCVGSSISIFDGTVGGTWSSEDPTKAIVPPTVGSVTGINAATVLISYTLGSGCYATHVVTVNPVPAPITASTTTICSNDSILLTDTDPLGKWSSVNTSDATVDSTGLVKGIAAGSSSIHYAFKATGCYDSVIMNINAAPSVAVSASGPTTFCAGGSVTLSIPSAGGGATYQWYNSGIVVSGATTTSYTTSVTQTLTVEVQNAAGCIATSAPDLILSGISPVLDSSGSSQFCTGNYLNLTAQTGVGALGVITYQWERNGTPIPSANDSNFLAGTSGLYDCIVTISGGGSGSCSAYTQQINITAYPLPNPVITSVETIGGTKFTANGGYNGYQWYLNTKSIPGAIYQTYIATINGSYRVSVTDSTGCTGYSNEILINNVGIGQVSTADVKIYPNPANAMVHIESPVSVHAVVTSIEGKTLLDEANATDINISGLANGLYIIILYNENGERLMLDKLIKQ